MREGRKGREKGRQGGKEGMKAVSEVVQAGTMSIKLAESVSLSPDPGGLLQGL